METTGERIAFLRTHLELGQSDFCDKVGIKHQSYLSELENDKARLTSKNALAMQQAFGVSSDWLLDGVGEMFPNTEDLVSKEVVKVHSGTPSERLLMWRESKGLTQQEVADSIGGYTQSGIHAAENRGNVSRKLATKLQLKLGLSRKWLMEGEGSMMLTDSDSDDNLVNEQSLPYHSSSKKNQSQELELKDIKDRLSALELDMKMIKKVLSDG